MILCPVIDRMLIMIPKHDVSLVYPCPPLLIETGYVLQRSKEASKLTVSMTFSRIEAKLSQPERQAPDGASLLRPGMSVLGFHTLVFRGP